MGFAVGGRDAAATGGSGCRQLAGFDGLQLAGLGDLRGNYSGGANRYGGEGGCLPVAVGFGDGGEQLTFAVGWHFRNGFGDEDTEFLVSIAKSGDAAATFAGQVSLSFEFLRIGPRFGNLVPMAAYFLVAGLAAADLVF